MIFWDKIITTKEEAVLRVEPHQLDELLHPIIDPAAEKKLKPFAKGLPAGPGGAAGQIVFNSEDAVEWAKSVMTQLAPKAAVLLKVTEIYSVQPGPDAGKRID